MTGKHTGPSVPWLTHIVYKYLRGWLHSGSRPAWFYASGGDVRVEENVVYFTVGGRSYRVEVREE